MTVHNVTNEKSPDPRQQELLWEHRTHPDELILPDVHPTRFPGRWVATFSGSIPNDQRNSLDINGYSLYRIRLLHDKKAQVVIVEEARPDRPDGEEGLSHEPTEDRYDQYDPYK